MKRQIDTLKEHLLANYADQPFSYITISRANSKDLRHIDNHSISTGLKAMEEQGMLVRTGKRIVMERARCYEYTIDADAIRASLAKRAARLAKLAEQETKPNYSELMDARLRQMGNALDNLHHWLDNIVRGRTGASA